MGTNFTGITFDDCNVSPSDDGIINRTILPDGILSGCEISYSGSTLTMAAGTLIACGRQFRHPAAQNWAVVDATTGYARLLITLDLTRSATDQTFDQVVDAVEYANDISGFPALVQQDLNAAGTKYQVVACVMSLGTGGISGIINTMPAVHPASTDGGRLTVTAPAGSTVTVSKDGKTLTRVAGADGIVVFRGLETGTWTLTITNGSETASKTVEIVADYATSITFFAATIHITYPAGSTCTATDGTTTITAPDTSGTWACVVPNAGTWEIVSGNYRRFLTISADGDNKTADVTKLFLFDNGDYCNNVTGGWTPKPWKQNEGFYDYEVVAPTINIQNGLMVIAPMKTSGYASGAILPVNDFDMGLYTKFCVEVTEFARPGGEFIPYAAVSDRSITYWGDAPAKLEISKTGTQILAFSFASGNKAPYVAIRCNDANANCVLRISKMWLE